MCYFMRLFFVLTIILTHILTAVLIQLYQVISNSYIKPLVAQMEH